MVRGVQGICWAAEQSRRHHDVRQKSVNVTLRRHVLQQLFLGSRAIPEKSLDIDKTLINRASFVDLMTGTEQEPARKLYLAWLERRTNPKATQEGLRGALHVELPEILLLVRKRIAQPKVEATTLGTLLLILGNRGEKKTDASEIEKYLNNRDTYANLSFSSGGRTSAQIRDLAAAMLLKLHGEDPEKYGFGTDQTIAWWVGKDPAPFVEVSIFDSDEKRDAAFKKFQEWRDRTVKNGK